MTTLIMVHGAYADSSSWDGVVGPLLDRGYDVLAFANPLRSVRADARLLSDLVRSVEGPVLLVGHSYGGAVITNVEASAGQVVGAVYVAGFALDAGESCVQASALTPGSTLAQTLQTVPLDDGGTDTFIAHGRYHDQFAADLPTGKTRLMSVGQRPVTAAALDEASGDQPLWRSVPTWFVFGSLDRNIPVGAHRRMAERAQAHKVVEIEGASHVVGISHPAETVQLVDEAATFPALAHA